MKTSLLHRLWKLVPDRSKNEPMREENILSVEKAVKQCYSKTELRDNQRSRIGKPKCVPWTERVKPT